MSEFVDVVSKATGERQVVPADWQDTALFRDFDLYTAPPGPDEAPAPEPAQPVREAEDSPEAAPEKTRK